MAWIFTLSSAIFFTSFTHGELIGASDSEMLNTAVVAGSTVTFSCRFNDSLSIKPSWLLNTPLSWVKTTLAVGKKLRSQSTDRLELNFDTQNERSSLSIVRATKEDAGIYECRRAVSEHVLSSYAAQLTVLASSPVCFIAPTLANVTVEDYQVEEFDYFEVGCSVNYCGNWAPTVQCRPQSVAINKSSVDDLSHNISYKLQIQALKNLTRTTFNCTIRFIEDNLPAIGRSSNSTAQDVQHVSKNTPNYTFSWSSPRITVLYGVQSAVIKSPDKSVVKHGDRFVCSADGKPSPRYQWINTLDNSVIDGHQYRVKYCNSQELSQFVLFCVASNVVFGKEYSTTVNVTVNVTSHICSQQAGSYQQRLRNNTFYGVCLAIICVLCFGSFIIVKVLSKSSTKTNASGSGSSSNANQHSADQQPQRCNAMSNNDDVINSPPIYAELAPKQKNGRVTERALSPTSATSPRLNYAVYADIDHTVATANNTMRINQL